MDWEDGRKRCLNGGRANGGTALWVAVLGRYWNGGEPWRARMKVGAGRGLIA